MKVFCGCMSTKDGTLAVLLLYLAVYLTGIILLGVSIDKEYIQVWYKDNAVKEYDCKGTDSIKDSWWCTAMFDMQYDIRTWQIVGIIVLSLFLILDLIALFGTTKGSQWPILPWLVLDFIRLAAKLIIFVMVIIVWAVYMGENEDSSYIVATGVLGAAALAFFFYLWLCVVSYFQLLREIDQIANIHKVGESGDSPQHQVTPFVADPYGDDQENPYDNLSEHTTKESLADTVSIKSRIKTPLAGDQVSMGGGGSTIDVKSTSLEQNE